MQRVSPVRVLAALAAVLCLSLLIACGGGNSVNTTVSQLVLSPTTFSMNEGAVATLAVSAENSAGTIVPADITFSSSNNNIATVSTGGLICAGQWDSVFINCTFTNGTAGVGQVTITAAFGQHYGYSHGVRTRAGGSSKAVLGSSCTTMGQPVNISGEAFSTTAPGCSPAAPCNITSTVGPFVLRSNQTAIVASSSGIVPTFNSALNTLTYSVGWNDYRFDGANLRSIELQRSQRRHGHRRFDQPEYDCRRNPADHHGAGKRRNYSSPTTATLTSLARPPAAARPTSLPR